MSALYPASSAFAAWSGRHRPPADGPTVDCPACEGTGDGESGCHQRVPVSRCVGACRGCFEPVRGGCPGCGGTGEVPDVSAYCPGCREAGLWTLSRGPCADCREQDVASCPYVPVHVEGCTCRRGLSTSGTLLGLTVTLAVSYLLALGVTAVTP